MNLPSSNILDKILSNENNIVYVNNNITNSSIISNISPFKHPKSNQNSNKKNVRKGSDEVDWIKSIESCKQSLKLGLFADKTKNVPRTKILIVDDNQFINDSFKILIAKCVKELGKNIDLIQLSDGIDMLKHIIDDQNIGNCIKLVLTDENMEYINGSEAIKILRNLENKNKIKKVKYYSITCQEDKNIHQMIIESGADGLLSKPIEKNTVLKLLQDIKN